jgi:small conductance mechanosensitive channel
MPDLKALWDRALEILGEQVVPVVLIVIVAFLFLRMSRLFIHGVFKTLMDREATEGTAQELSAVEVQKRIETLDALGANVLRFFIVVIAGLMVLGRFGIDIGPAVAGLGVVGVAVGFGAQHLVRDYLNGSLILIENQFSRGDVVRIAGVSGTVEDFSLRRTTLRDLDGLVHTVPNGEIAVATNLTRVWARINLDVMVAFATDIDRAMQVVDRVGAEMAGDPAWKRRLLESPRVERVEAIGEFGITLKILGTVRAPDRWAAAGELRKRLLVAFREHGIDIPRPQRVVLADRAAEQDETAGTAGGPNQDELAEGVE